MGKVHKPTAAPQAGILPEPREHAWFLILTVRDAAAAGPAVAKMLAGVPALTDQVAARDPRAKLTCTVAIGAELWSVISPGRRPRGLRPFAAIDAEGRRAPNTGGDVLLHLISKRPDLNFELARHIRGALGDRVTVMDEVHGFRYLDNRDLTGFIDGTENPKGKARAAVALIGDEDPAFAGGSYVFTQRYVHDLARWASIALKEQEGAIGRRKRDSKELADSVKPPTAHIARVVIEENGAELEIVRHSFPYGTVSEAGLFFIAYTRDLGITEKMLRRMMGTSGDGLHDHLMDFTRAVSGATFFAPSLKLLKSLGRK
jgi:putative iron-dependent peroxidase